MQTCGGQDLLNGHREHSTAAGDAKSPRHPWNSRRYGTTPAGAVTLRMHLSGDERNRTPVPIGHNAATASPKRAPRTEGSAGIFHSQRRRIRPDT